MENPKEDTTRNELLKGNAGATPASVRLQILGAALVLLGLLAIAMGGGGGKGIATCKGAYYSRDTYNVGGMDVVSLTGTEEYSKVVIMLHGGQGSGAEWENVCGWLEMSDTKYVFPTSALAGGVWYEETDAAGCGLCDECAYSVPSIEASATAVAALIDHEKGDFKIGGDASKVYLAGFGQGAQVAGYTQLQKLDFSLGGVAFMSGYPLPPSCGLPGKSETEALALVTNSGSDMRWFLWHGNDDPVFHADDAMVTMTGIFDTFDVTAEVVKVQHIEADQGHSIIEKELSELNEFIED